MTFITSHEIDRRLDEIGVKQVLAKYGRYRIAPGFTVADYVKIGEFYRTAGQHLPEDRRPVERHALEPA